MSKQHVFLSHNWQCKAYSPGDDFADSTGWFPATVPGVVQQDLLASGQIPDPFVGLQENEIQWVGERDWLYRCTFEVSAGLLASPAIALCCDGLDTFATVWLNGTQVLTSDNMFVPLRAQVKHLLREGSNELYILFESALRRGREREAEHGVLTHWLGDSSRLYVRKAQYHYGWDWGPTLLTAGPWRPVYLEAYAARFVDLHCPVEVTAELDRATFAISAAIERHASLSLETLSLSLTLYSPTGEVSHEALLPLTAGTSAVQYTISIENPALWWPRGYGEQPLYRLVATLTWDGTRLDQRELRLGARRLQLLQPVNEQGSDFFFAINNMPIFCGGANWIPADSLTTRLTGDHYRRWLRLAADANMTMLRVWGGGIYEDNLFYELCDELGLLIWQDFMFACGIYPTPDWFRRSVRAEVEAVVRRLRHHPSLVLWCGNNEDYLVADSLDAYDPAFTGDFTTTPFPAREIYERLIPGMLAELDPARPYWPGSPYGGTPANAGTAGDQHIWEVWHDRMRPYQDYPIFEARFVSEFGMQAYPTPVTIEEFTAPDERYPQSRTLDHHNKARGGQRHLAVYLADNVRPPADLADYVYATQFIQSEALASAIQSWRRRWHPTRAGCVGGALIWQLNDCWPAISWAIVDYCLRPKPAYYTVRRLLAPLTVGLASTPAGEAEVWAVNGTTQPFTGMVEIKRWTLEGELSLEEQRPVQLSANQATELGVISWQYEAQEIVAVRLLCAGEVVARATLWPEPFKYLPLPDPGLKIEHLDDERLLVQAQRPAKGVLLTAGDDDVTWSDNMLDVLPGDPQILRAAGLHGRSVQVRWLGQDW